MNIKRYIDDVEFYNVALTQDQVSNLSTYVVDSVEKPHINRCVFSNNGSLVSTSHGGGIYSNLGCVRVFNSLFYGNKADLGGAISLEDSLIDIVNCTISDNQAADDDKGGGVYSLLSNVNILNSILWGNKADGDAVSPDEPFEDDLEAQLYIDDAYLADVEYCCIEDDVAGDTTVPYNNSGNETNIDTDPLFVDDTNADPDDNDYHLQNIPTESPGIDAGSNSLIFSYGIANLGDLDFYMRIQNDVVDIGCYEHGDAAVVQLDTVIMCWIDESMGEGAGGYYFDDPEDSVYGDDFDLFHDALSNSNEYYAIGVYVPYASGYDYYILPWSLNISNSTVLGYDDKPVGVNIVKRVDPVLTITEIRDEAMDEFDVLRNGAVPSKVILLKDVSTSTPSTYVGFKDSIYVINTTDICGVDEFAYDLASTYYGMDIDVVDMSTGASERWLYDIANEID